MAQQLNYDEFLNDSIKATRLLIEQTQELKNALKQVGEQSQKNIDALSVSESTKDYNKLIQEVNTLTDAQKQLSDVLKNENKLKQRETELLKEQIKQQEILKQEKEALKQQVISEIALGKQHIKTKENLEKANKALTVKISKLNLETKEGVTQYKELSQKILENKKVITDLDKEVKKSIVTSESYNKALEIEEKLSKNLIKTKADLKEANAVLRKAVDNLDFTKQGDEIERLNKLIEENSAIINENSDAQLQQKNNIGNYEESVISAIEKTGLFSKELKVFNAVQLGVNKLLKRNTEDLKEQTKETKKSTDAQQELNQESNKSSGGISKLGKVIGVIGATISLLATAFTKTSEGALGLEIIMLSINNIINVIIQRVGNLGKGLFDTIIGGFGTLVSKSDFLRDKLGITQEEVNKFNKQYEEGIKKVTTAFDGLKEQLKEVTALSEEYVLSTRQIGYERRILEQQQAKEVAVLNKLGQLRDAESISLQERIEFAKRYALQNEKVGKNDIALAKNNIKLVEEEVNLELRKAGIIAQSSNVLQNINKFESLRSKIAPELLDKLSQSYVELTNAESEFTNLQVENLRELNTLTFDLLEQRLDRIVQFNDLVIGLNEEIISNDKIAFEDKLEAQKKINKLVQETFDTQLKNVIDLQKITRENEIEQLKLTLKGSELKQALAKKQQDLLLDEQKIRDILNSETAEQFYQQIEALKTSERINTQIADIIVQMFENKQKIYNLDSSINDEQLSILETQEETLRIEEETLKIKEQNLKLEKLQQDLENKNLSKDDKARILKEIQDIENEKIKIQENSLKKQDENRIKALNRELEQVKVNSKRYFEIKKELADIELNSEQSKNDKLLTKNKEKNNKIIEADKKATDETLEDDKEKLKKQKDSIDKLLTFVDGYLKTVGDKRLSALDKEIDNVKSRESELIALINSGNSNAQESLSKLRAQEDKLNKEKEKQQKKAEKQALILATLKTFNSNLDNGKDSKQSLVDTILSVVSLSQFINSLPSFAKGTDSFSFATENVNKNTGVNIHDGIDGQLAMINVGERVIPTDLNKKLGGISNKNLVELVNKDMNDISYNNAKNTNTIINTFNDDKIVKELRNVQNSIASIKTTNITYDTILDIVKTEIKSNNTVKNIYSKLNTRR